MSNKKTYRVFFEQVNQQYVEVEAYSKQTAMKKAVKEWKADIAVPTIIAVES